MNGQNITTGLNPWMCSMCGTSVIIPSNPTTHYCPRGPVYTITYTGYQTQTNTNPKETPVEIAKRLRELKLSKADRLLYKHGLITESGQLTDTGRQVVLEAAFATVKDGIVADLEALDAEDKSKK